jgi:hypothetical protein
VKQQRMEAEALPNFLMIGATKSGSTALYHYLKQHPDIYTSPHKGPHFFAYEPNEVVYEIGPGYRHVAPNFITDPDAYRALFEDARIERARGEASVMYMYYPEAPRRIKEAVPHAKLIAVLRQPAERAFSAYLHQLRDGHEVHQNFAQALEAEETRIQEGWTPLWHYRKMGFYYEQLERFYDLFPEAQIQVYLYEDFKAQPQETLKSIFRFLAVDDTFSPDVRLQRNISGIPKNRTLHRVHRFLKNPSGFKTLGKAVVPAGLRAKIKRYTLTNLETKNLHKPSLEPSLRRELNDGYRSDIRKLQGLIGRDLSHWLE